MNGTTLISVRVTAEVAKRLAALAEATDRSKSYIAAQAIEDFLSLQEWQIKAIRKGIAEADAGELVGHKQALKALSKWGRHGA